MNYSQSLILVYAEASSVELEVDFSELSVHLKENLERYGAMLLLSLDGSKGNGKPVTKF